MQRFIPSFHTARILKHLATVSILSISVAATAQTYPTFTEGAKNPQTLASGSASPTLFSNGATLQMAYVDSSSGCIEIAYTNNGYQFTQTNGTPICPGANTTVAATYTSNGVLVVAYVLNGTLYTALSNDGGATFGPVNAAWELTVAPTGRPSMVPYGGPSVLMAYASGSGIYYTIYNTAPVTINDTFSPSVQIGSGYPATSNPSVTPFGTGGVEALVWLTGTGFPVVAILPPPDPSLPLNEPTPPTSVTETTGIEIGGDPSPVAWNGGLFIFGRSYYSADNLWAIGTKDGIFFEPQQEYGQTLTNSPSVFVWGSGSQLTEAARSNYGSNIWAYWANY